MPATSTLARLAAAALLPALVACSSPNRGTWRGDFTGSLSGVVEFRIGTRGTRLEGTIEGTTAGGQPFSAEMEGKIHGRDFYATFAGTGRTEVYPVPFEGFMRGELGNGTARGDWEAQLRMQPEKMRGDWSVRQVAVE